MRKKLLFFLLVALSIGVTRAQNPGSEIQANLNKCFLFPDVMPTLLGKSFVYNNIASYSTLKAPYPIKDGRVRSGKYKSSDSAFEEYVNELKSQNGKVFKFAKFTTIDDWSGVVFENEQGDSIFYIDNIMISAEFTSVDYMKYVEDIIVGNNFIYKKDNVNSPKVIPYLNVSTGETRNDFPEGTEFSATKIGIYNHYIGEHSSLADGHNSFCHLAVCLHNEKLGDYLAPISANSFDGLDNLELAARGIPLTDKIATMGVFEKASKGNKLKYKLGKFGKLLGK